MQVHLNSTHNTNNSTKVSQHLTVKKIQIPISFWHVTNIRNNIPSLTFIFMLYSFNLSQIQSYTWKQNEIFTPAQTLCPCYVFMAINVWLASLVPI